MRWPLWGAPFTSMTYILWGLIGWFIPFMQMPYRVRTGSFYISKCRKRPICVGVNKARRRSTSCRTRIRMILVVWMLSHLFIHNIRQEKKHRKDQINFSIGGSLTSSSPRICDPNTACTKKKSNGIFSFYTKQTNHLHILSRHFERNSMLFRVARYAGDKTKPYIIRKGGGEPKGAGQPKIEGKGAKR